MTAKQYIRALAEANGMEKHQVESIMESMVELIETTTKDGEAVIVPGLGRFSVVHRKARTGRNPRTGEAMQIKASQKFRFTPNKDLKESVAGAKVPAKKTAAKKRTRTRKAKA